MGFVCIAITLHLFWSEPNHRITEWEGLEGTSVGHLVQETTKVSFSGDIQDLPGQGPLQPTVGDPASAEGLD